MMKRSRKSMWCVGGLLLASAGAFGQVALDEQVPPARGDLWPTGANLADPDAEFLPNQIIVKYRATAPANAGLAARPMVQAQLVHELRIINAELWRLPLGSDVNKAIRSLTTGPMAQFIEYAEPNFIVHAHDFPADPRRADLWGMHNIGQTGGTTDADIDAPDAWTVETGSVSIIVGIIDTGIDYTHEDLAANIWSNPGEIADNGVDDDGNGFIDDVRGWDFVSDDNDPMDDHGHGTHTAGTVGAVGDNGVGVMGVAWDVSLMPLKFLNSGGSGSTANAIRAIEYAAGFGVPITNNSWGGGRKSKALENAIIAADALFVASAGNSNSSRKQYPAGYAAANIVSVAATDHNDARASFSNYGSGWVDLGAPGVNTVSCAPGNGYTSKSGTSMAAPHVAGTAALVLSQSPGLSTSQLRDQIFASVDQIPSMQGITSTGGRLNAARAVGVEPPPPGSDTIAPATITDLAADPLLTTFDSITLSWTATGDDGVVGTAYAYDIRYSLFGLDESTWAGATRASGEPLPGVPGSLEGFVIDGLRPDQTVYAGIKAMDEAGNLSGISNVVIETTTAPPPGAWNVQTVATAGGGTYISLDHGPTGAPAVVYNTGGTIQYCELDASTGVWSNETVMDGGPGLSLAFDPNTGSPTISHGWGKLYFNTKTGGSWLTDIVESKRANNDVTWLDYDGNGDPGISYRSGGRNGGLKYASRSGGVWTVQTVDQGAGARYSALAFGPDGHPAIAYSEDIDNDGWLDTMKVARYDGSSWNIEVVDTGGVGYGVHAGIGFDPLTGQPSASHRGTGQIRFLRFDGAGWQVEMPDPTTEYVFGLAFIYGTDGTVHLTYNSATETFNSAMRDPGTGAWTLGTVDYSAGWPFLIRMRLTAAGLPSVAYDGGSEIRYAEKGAP